MARKITRDKLKELIDKRTKALSEENDRLKLELSKSEDDKLEIELEISSNEKGEPQSKGEVSNDIDELYNDLFNDGKGDK